MNNLDISPLLAILRRVTSRLLVLAFVCACLTSTLVYPVFAQQPAPAAGGSALDAATQQQVTDLKLQAQDAFEAKDLPKALALYKRILRLNPDDPLALKRSEELTEAVAKQTEGDRAHRVDQATQQAAEALTGDRFTRAEDALVDARRTHAAAPLDKARRLLDEARKFARPGDARIDRLQRAVDAEASLQRVAWWELWGSIAFVALVVIAAAVFYMLRSGRRLQVIEGSQIGQIFALQKQSTSIGALASAVDWALEDPSRKISRLHCEVFREGRHYFIVDRSLNGTLLNGRPLQKDEAALLKRGDEVVLGGGVKLRFR